MIHNVIESSHHNKVVVEGSVKETRGELGEEGRFQAWKSEEEGRRGKETRMSRQQDNRIHVTQKARGEITQDLVKCEVEWEIIRASSAGPG